MEEIIAIIISSSIQLIILTVTIRHFNKSFNHNQKQFEKQMKINTDAELIKQLAYFDEQFQILAEKFNNSPSHIKYCLRLTNNWLLLLDRLCYLEKKERLDKDFMPFFNLRAELGISLIRWREIISPRINLDITFPNLINYLLYHELGDTNLLLMNPFYYYAYKILQNPSYDIDLDESDCKLWDTPKDEIGKQLLSLLAQKSRCLQK